MAPLYLKTRILNSKHMPYSYPRHPSGGFWRRLLWAYYYRLPSTIFRRLDTKEYQTLRKRYRDLCKQYRRAAAGQLPALEAELERLECRLDVIREEVKNYFLTLSWRYRDKLRRMREARRELRGQRHWQWYQPAGAAADDGDDSLYRSYYDTHQAELKQYLDERFGLADRNWRRRNSQANSFLSVIASSLAIGGLAYYLTGNLAIGALTAGLVLTAGLMQATFA